jgi:hypothetical protein
MSMCNEIEFNIIFLVVPLQWTVVNIVGIYYCDYTIFTSWIDRENKKTCN